MKKGVAYEFKDAKAKNSFYNRMLTNQDIVAAIEGIGGKFYVGDENDVGNCFLYTTDRYLTVLKDSDDVDCVIREEEFQYFKEVNSFNQSATLDKFDKAVASFREYRSDRPFSAELENALDMIRFGISIQN